MKGRRKGTVVLSVLLLLVVTFTVSAGGTKESDQAVPGEADSKYGGVLRYGLMTNPTILGYPAEITNNGPLPFIDPILQSLAYFDETGTLTPWLAESWTVDADAKTITFKLRQGISFSDGTPFNAEAVKWNIEKYIEAKRGETANIDSIKVVDDHTVLINLKAWNSSSIDAIGYFVRYISPAAFKEHGKDWCMKNPVGTGPFVFDTWEVNVSVTYNKNENYWEEGKPYLDRIELFYFQDPNTLASALKAGELDIASPILVELVDDFKDDEYEIITHSNGIGAVGMGVIADCVTEGSIWSDVKVRKALCYAIDSESIARVFGRGYYTVTNQWGPPGVITYNPNVKGYPYNPEKAKQLLAEAGYAPGEAKTKLFTHLGTKDVMTAVQAQLEEVGFDVDLVLVDEAKTQALYFGTWEGGLMGHFHSVQPDLGLYMFRHLDPNGAFYAKGIYHPEDVLELLKKNQQAPNQEVKKQTSMELQRLVYDEYCLVGKPLYIPSGIFVKHSYVHDDTVGLMHSSFWTPGNTWMSK